MAAISYLLTNPLLWLVFLALALGLLLLAWRLRLRWRPAWLLRLALLALVLLGLFWPARRGGEAQAVPPRTVLVVDQSDSLDEAGRQQAWQQAMQWQAGGEDRLVVAFGAQAEAVAASAGGVPRSPQIDGRASDIAGALRLAGGLLGAAPGRVILASDGRTPDTLAVDQAVAELARQGHRLDSLPLSERPAANDLAVGQLNAPTRLWSGTSFDVLAPVYEASGAGKAQVSLWIDGRASGIEPEGVGSLAGPAGRASAYRFHVPSLPAGIATLEVRAAWPEGTAGGEASSADPFLENNAAFGVLQVFPAPKVLFVTAQPGTPAVERLTGALSDRDVVVDVQGPEGLPTRLEQLQQYGVIVLHNLLASQLSGEQMSALQIFVSRQAGGLVVLGGRNSYLLGGYQGTRLEPMLPVKLEPPPRSERPPIVFQLILDRSSSMSNRDPRSENTPIALAREAAMRTIETMRGEDYLGVLTFSDDPSWDFPLRAIGDAAGLRAALDAVSRVDADGSTYMFKAMQEALANMSSLPADAPRNRHILVLSDGQSTDGSDEEFMQLVQQAQQQGITISSIALGQDVNGELMQRLAEAGKGRFYAVKDADDLPRILLAESQAARSENVQEGQTSLKVSAAGHPILSGLSPRLLPPLTGYNALQSKAAEGAEDVLVSASFDDPILSIWQYGLGRVTAWTSDLGEEWMGSWPAGDEGAFWAQVVLYTLVDPGLGPAQVQAEVDATQLNVQAAIYTPAGEPLNLADVTFTYVDAQGQAHAFYLLQSGAGLYQLRLPRPEAGAYRAVVRYEQNGQRFEVPAPFVADPPAEWLPAADGANGGPATGNLSAWAAATGGTLTSLDQALSPAQPAAAATAQARSIDWRRLLLLAALLYWPVEIAVRRRWMPWM